MSKPFPRVSMSIGLSQHSLFMQASKSRPPPLPGGQPLGSSRQSVWCLQVPFSEWSYCHMASATLTPVPEIVTDTLHRQNRHGLTPAPTTVVHEAPFCGFPPLVPSLKDWFPPNAWHELEG